MFSLVIKPPVYEMLDEAYQWYEQQLPGLGERLLKEIDICFDKLRNTPFYYSIDKDQYRQIRLKFFPYKIIFEIINDAVVVYALFHTKQDAHKD